jgi:hypothetical protein
MTQAPPPPELFRCPVDTECYPNYWLFGIRYATGDVWQCRAVGPFSALTESDRQTMRRILSTVPIWTFNGNRYDLWMIAAALAGYTVGQLKVLNDKIIAERIAPWTLGIPRFTPADHIDVMEVIPGAGGQKYKAGIIHYRTMRDLPYDIATNLDADQMANVDQYNANDLGQLLALAEAVRPQIALREKLSDRYGMDLRSKSDAQVAEAVIKARCEAALGRQIPRSDPDWNQTFTYDAPEYLAAISHPALREALAAATSATFSLSAAGAVTLPASLEGRTVTIGAGVYRMGIGGLHSSEERAAHRADDDYMLVDVDVASYYPNLMLNAGAWPEALGAQFLHEFKSIMVERLAAKSAAKTLLKGTPEQIEAATMDGGGKIMINGTFGKTGSVWSPLFAPKMMIRTTLTGQLSLMLLIEWLEAAGIRAVSANTDGVVLKLRRADLAVMRAIVKRWETAGGLEMEETHYSAIYSRDVNNYLAVTTEGKVKRKGVYSPTSLIMKKAPALEICADACAEYVRTGTPVADTILMCADLRKFVIIKNVAGGACKMWGDGPRNGQKVADMLPRLTAHGWTKQGVRWVHPSHPEPLKAGDAYPLTFAPQRPEVLGKVVRWYYSTQAPGPIVYASGKKQGDLVSDSWGAMPTMVLPDTLPADIDYVYYVDIATQMLRDCAAI